MPPCGPAEGRQKDSGRRRYHEIGMSETGPERPLPPEIENAIRAVALTDRPEVAALTLAAIAHRAIVELNKLARAEAVGRRGTPEWGTWAGLANSARDAVLRVSTCRKSAGELARGATGEGT